MDTGVPPPPVSIDKTGEYPVPLWISRWEDVFSIIKENHMVTTASSKNLRWLYLPSRNPRDISLAPASTTGPY